jgi:hypothetical protein
LLPGASLRAGRNLDEAPQIDQQIDDKAFHIKYLDTKLLARPAGKRLPVLREAAGTLWIDIRITRGIVVVKTHVNI